MNPFLFLQWGDFFEFPAGREKVDTDVQVMHKLGERAGDLLNAQVIGPIFAHGGVALWKDGIRGLFENRQERGMAC